MEEFGGYGFGVADEECTFGATKNFELIASDRRPAALFTDLGEGFGVTREEVVGGLLIGVGYVAESMDADFEGFGCMAGAEACSSIEFDEGTESVGLAADDGDHKGKAEVSCADEGFGGASYS